MVTNVNSLRELAGCNVINGSLEIIMKGGSEYSSMTRLDISHHYILILTNHNLLLIIKKENVLRELEMAFQDLEEIKGYLKITRSYPILTLGFLNGLKAVNGSELERDQ